jgi:hypothetical protein
MAIKAQAKPTTAPLALPTETPKKTTTKALKKAPAKAKKIAVETNFTDLPVENQIPPFSVKEKKAEKKKVIRDSFSFPEHDYHKISELKKICLAAGIHVKKGEILRAGLHLLTNLKLTELIQAMGKVEKVSTGRPKSSKK